MMPIYDPTNVDEHDETLVLLMELVGARIAQKPIASDEVIEGSAEYFLGQFVSILSMNGLLKPFREIMGVIPPDLIPGLD